MTYDPKVEFTGHKPQESAGIRHDIQVVVPELRLVCDLHLHLKGSKTEVLEGGQPGRYEDTHEKTWKKQKHTGYVHEKLQIFQSTT